METGTADSGHADHRRALCGADRWFYCIALQSSADFCGKLADKDSFLYKGQSVSLCGVVSDPDGSCMDRRKTGEVGTDDFRQRDSAGGRGSIRTPFSELETSAAAKFAGGFLCMLGGLSLGREGPSIQLGAMAGQGISRALGRGKREEKFLMTCGASAGLSAAFHAPLAGMMFAVEEIHKTFSIPILLPVMTASVTADYIASHILGLDPVFHFQITEYLPQNYYWLLILLGILVGVSGVFYNWGMLKAQELYHKIPFLKETGRLLIAFLTAGVLGLVMPSVLGSGSGLIVSLTKGEMVLGMVVLTLVVKFLFSAVSFGSGAPGGIFFPLLILGALLGAVFAMTGAEFFGLDPVYINNFVLLGMTGFFTAIVRAPLTGIILLFEMSGSISQMLSLSIVSVTAYIVATLMRSEPIYDSLLKRILKADTIVHDK